MDLSRLPIIYPAINWIRNKIAKMHKPTVIDIKRSDINLCLISQKGKKPVKIKNLLYVTIGLHPGLGTNSIKYPNIIHSGCIHISDSKRPMLTACAAKPHIKRCDVHTAFKCIILNTFQSRSNSFRIHQKEGVICIYTPKIVNPFFFAW